MLYFEYMCTGATGGHINLPKSVKTSQIEFVAFDTGTYSWKLIEAICQIWEG